MSGPGFCRVRVFYGSESGPSPSPGFVVCHMKYSISKINDFKFNSEHNN